MTIVIARFGLQQLQEGSEQGGRRVFDGMKTGYLLGT